MVDEEKQAHDEGVVKTIKEQATREAEWKFGLKMTSDEEKCALGIFPKVSLSQQPFIFSLII